MKHPFTRLAMAAAILVQTAGCGGGTRVPATEGSRIEVLDGLAVTYLATPGLLDEAGIATAGDFGVAANGNVILNTPEGPFELEGEDGELAAGRLEGATRLDAMAMDSGEVVLGIRDRFLGQIGSDGFQKALPLPEGRHRLASSSRAGTVYLVREGDGGSRLYAVRDDGTLSTLAEFSGAVRAVADDAETTFVATDAGVFAIDANGIRLTIAASEDLPPPTSIAAAPDRLFLVARNRVYLAANGMLLAIARGLEPELILSGTQLYCWDRRRRLLLAIDVGSLSGKG